MSYNEPYQVDLILNRFQIPLYVTSTYNGDEFVPPVAVSDFRFSLPWYVFLDNSLASLTCSALTVECVNYKHDDEPLSKITDFLTRDDPGCSFTVNRTGPGLFVNDIFSEDFISRSVKLPEEIISFFDDNVSLRPLGFPGRKNIYSQTPVFSVLRGNSLNSIYNIGIGRPDNPNDLDCYYLRDEPPSVCEFPDLTTFNTFNLSGVDKICYYDTTVSNVSCTLEDGVVEFDSPVSGLIILRLIKKINITGYKEEQSISENSSVIYYIFAPLAITTVYLANSKPKLSSFVIDDTVKWSITIKNLYNETKKTAVRYTNNILNAETKLHPNVFANGPQTITTVFPELHVSDKTIAIGSTATVEIVNDSRIIQGKNGSATSVFEGIENGDVLYLGLTLSH